MLMCQCKCKCDTSQPGIRSRLLLMPVQSSSVLSVFNFSQLADIQWPMAVTQHSKSATDKMNLINSTMYIVVSCVCTLRYVKDF